jgi:inner membrane protein
MSEQSFLLDRATRFGIMIGLIVLMFVPLIFIGLVIEERASYQADTLSEVGGQWGGQQTVSGPYLVIPVDRQVTEAREVDGRTLTETRTEAGDPVILLPERLDVTGTLRSEIRSRGIFDVPVYATELEIATGFDTSRVAAAVGEGETLRWQDARVELHLSNTRGLRSAIVLKAGATELPLEPGSHLSGFLGVHAAVDEASPLASLRLSFTLNGSERIHIAPAGRQTEVALSGDWPHPSFTGGFLPNEREVTATGFTARWSVPHLARDIGQIVRGGGSLMGIQPATFGVDLYNPVDFYQKVSRATKYGILFIALTFLTVFLMEGLASRPVHPAQYVLIGVAQCVFFLLLLGFAEHAGFTPAYAIAAAATILLLAFYAFAALKLGRRAAVVVAVLVLLYATLYLILQSIDYAMLAGALLAFAAVALTMILTRNESWFGERSAGPAAAPVRVPAPAPSAGTLP